MQMKKDHVRAFLVVALFLLLLAVALVPMLHYMERTYQQYNQAEAEKSFHSAMRRLCQNENASWGELPNGDYQCFDKRGMRTIIVKKEKLL